MVIRYSKQVLLIEIFDKVVSFIFLNTGRQKHQQAVADHSLILTSTFRGQISLILLKLSSKQKSNGKDWCSEPKHYIGLPVHCIKLLSIFTICDQVRIFGKNLLSKSHSLSRILFRLLNHLRISDVSHLLSVIDWRLHHLLVLLR